MRHRTYDTSVGLVNVFGDPLNDSPILVHALASFMDAGSAGRLALNHIVDSSEARVIAEFDIDKLFDYRGRRPRATFLSDHYGEIDMPRLLVKEVTDAQGQQFLALQGPEPDFGWLAMRDAIVQFVQKWNIDLVVGLQGIPFPAPHTRPVFITAHGTDESIVAGRRPWVGNIEIPGSLAGLVEIALGRQDRRCAGLVAHVPHYLTNVEHPASAVRLIEELSSITGLAIPLDELRDKARETDEEISKHFTDDADNAQIVSALEQQYDEQVASRGEAGSDESVDVPTADEIAAQVEQFLADLDK